MAVEMNENVCYNVPGTIMKDVNKRNAEYENINNKILNNKISSSYFKPNQEISKSSPNSKVKTYLAVTFSVILLLQVILSSVIVVLYLKVSTLETQEPALSVTTEVNKTLVNHFKFLQMKFREFLQQYNASKESIFNTISHHIEQNFSFLEKILYREITSLNDSVQTFQTILKIVYIP